MNFVPARLEDGRVRASGLDVPCAAPSEGGRDVLTGIRPHDVVPAEGAGHLQLAVEVLETMGFEAYAHGRVGEAPFIARLEAAQADLLRPGSTLALDVPPSALHLFDPATERALGEP